jgi:hypothetical protein
MFIVGSGRLHAEAKKLAHVAINILLLSGSRNGDSRRAQWRRELLWKQAACRRPFNGLFLPRLTGREAPKEKAV